ncbi:hypothetical protein RHMOL_Rhmol02G0060800 [Rhododendron molle]|uniref:Uncharacterized protein n=1 Tax=Rhododendron molle TaxID=49168 RepID=A0ACC0PNL6_RHOML|nr:hypothetical protein RHMOL_Rhmol02G0060800 [Rhododendron molle]
MVVGCCDGLVCIAAGNEVWIWNPSTRKSKRLPNAGMPCLFYRYGFGYDESIDDCKVVGFFSNSGASGGDVEVKLYTSKTDWWWSIVDSSDFIPWNDSGIYVKGALHWAPWGRSCQVIVSLDLAKKKFGKVLQPDYRDGPSQSMLAVCVQMGIHIGESSLEMYHDAQTFGLESSYTKAVSNSNLAITWLESTFSELCRQATGGNLSAVKAQPYALFYASMIHFIIGIDFFLPGFLL